MALTTNKKNKIIAEWKAGKYKSYYAVAKAHKISQPKAKELLLNISMSNSHVVEAGIAYENGKNITKNLVEQKAIEEVVKEKTAHERMKEAVLDNVLKISVHTTTASAKLLQANSTAKSKMDGNELLTLQKVGKEAKATVIDKEEKSSTNIQMTQMMSQQEEVVTETIVVTDNKDMLEKMGLL